MARKQRGIIVYHGTLSEQAPHRVSQREGIFHAGTRQSAIDRLSHQVDIEDEHMQPEIAIHEYEIMPDAPMSMMTYTDPVYETSTPLPKEDQKHIERQSNWNPAVHRTEKFSSEALQVNRGNITNTIKKYLNLVEDPGSMSYQIPTHLVPSKVRHLSTQFYGYNPDVEDPFSDAEAVPGAEGWWRYKPSDERY